jgi:hypothetical protein
VLLPPPRLPRDWGGGGKKKDKHAVENGCRRERMSYEGKEASKRLSHMRWRKRRGKGKERKRII